MRMVITIFLAIDIFLSMSSLVLAGEASKYNFASAQKNKQLKIAPGDEGRGTIYFYNIDGNRVTHITLKVSKAPGAWDVKIEPPLHETEVEIGGKRTTVTENLCIEPSDVLSEEAKVVPDGMVCIAIPSRGYALAKAANIIVRVPEGERISAKDSITISAEAEWLGQSGAAAIKQTRDFDFSVDVLSKETDFSETIIDNKKNAWIIGLGSIIMVGAIVILGVVR